MKPRLLLTAAFLLLFAGLLSAHDLFLKLDSFFLAPNAKATVYLINGTFEKSENAIARDRMTDVRIVGPEDEVEHPEESQWRDVNDAALLDFTTGGPGTYTIGVSTASRLIELTAADFNEYLEHDGVLDVLVERERAGELDRDAVERYAKHVKAVIQVGDARTGAFAARTGYPVEFVPLQNPYTLKAGDRLDVLFLENGTPVAGQRVYASHEGYHGHDEAGGHREAVETRTDEQGVASIELVAPGRWYVRTIFMKKIDEAGVDYESQWATLTFEIR